MSVVRRIPSRAVIAFAILLLAFAFVLAVAEARTGVSGAAMHVHGFATRLLADGNMYHHS